MLEIRSCASTLGFKNLDSGCFDFLLPKFFSSRKSSPKTFQRKRCCRDIWKEKTDVEDVRADSSLPETSEPEKIQDQLTFSSNLHQNTSSPRHSETETTPRAESYFFCPKYTKFLQACGTARAGAESMSTTTTATENCPLAPRSTQICPMIASCSLGGSDPVSPPSQDSLEDSTGSCGVPECPRSTERSSVEMEVANQLSTWPTVCSLQPSVPLSMPCPGADLQCPFLRDLGTPSDRSAQFECPYTSSVNSDEDSDSSDEDADSESGISEQASKVRCYRSSRLPGDKLAF